MNPLRCLILTCLFLVPTSLHADFLVSVGSLTLQPGHDGYIDVNITSNNHESLYGFSVSYLISAPGLEFFAVSPTHPDDLQLNSSRYVFFGNSQAVSTSTLAGTISTNKDIYAGLDTTANGAGVLISSVAGTGTLLTELHVVATTAAPGASFFIRVDPDPFITSFGGDINFTPIAFTSTSGNVQVAGTLVTPLPGGFVLALCGIGSAGLCRLFWKGQKCSRNAD